MIIHEIRMKELITFTRKMSGTEPYGCAIYDTYGNMLVSTTGNKASPINHAEIIAINQCVALNTNIKWDSLTLYTTGEPCCMCAAACCWSNLKEIIYATDIPFMIELWKIESSERAIDIINHHPKKPNIIGGICKDESNKLFLERKNIFAQTCKEKRWL